MHVLAAHAAAFCYMLLCADEKTSGGLSEWVCAAHRGPGRLTDYPCAAHDPGGQNRLSIDVTVLSFQYCCHSDSMLVSSEGPAQVGQYD